MKAVITLTDNDAGWVDVQTIYEPDGLNVGRSAAHALAAQIIAAATKLVTPDREQLDGAVVHQVTAAQIQETQKLGVGDVGDLAKTLGSTDTTP